MFLHVSIESVDSISRDEPDSPLTQYITNAGISRARYTVTLFKHHHRVMADFQSNMCITSLYSASLRMRRTSKKSLFGILLSSSSSSSSSNSSSFFSRPSAIVSYLLTLVYM